MIARLVIGATALSEQEAAWRALERTHSVCAFQRFAWARAWVAHLGANTTPALAIAGDPPVAILPLAARRAGGIKVLGLLGEGVTDLLGTVPLDAPAEAYRAIGASLRTGRPSWDLLDWRSLAASPSQRAGLAQGLGRALITRTYERCPYIETAGTWGRFLASRSRSFRKDLKKAERRVLEKGEAAVLREEPSAELFEEFVEVERDSWKWAGGRALLRRPDTRSFLREVLLNEEIAPALWTLRVGGKLAGFATVLQHGDRRLYYLSSFRQDFPKAGAFLMAAIVRECFSSSANRFDFLQGDQSYKLAWCDGEDAVHEIAAAGSSLIGAPALLALRARWHLARSARLRRWREAAAARRWQRSEP